MALMTLASSRRDSFTSSSWLSRNSWRSCSASNSSRASGLIGPMIRSSRSSSRTRPAGVDALGQRRALGGHGHVGLESRSRRSASTAVSMRSLISASSISSRCWRSRTSASALLGLGPLLAQPVELGGDRAGRLGLLAPTALAQLAELGLDARRAARRRGRSGDRWRAAARRARAGAPRPRRARCGRCGRAAPRPRRGGARRNWRRSLDRAGAAHLEVGAQGADLGGPLLEPGPGLAHGAAPLGGLGLLGLEPGSSASSSAMRSRSRPTRSASSARWVRRASASVAASRRSVSTRCRPSPAALSRPSLSSSWRGQVVLGLAGLVERAAAASASRPAARPARPSAAALGPRRGPRRARRRWPRRRRRRPASRWGRSGRRRG